MATWDEIKKNRQASVKVNEPVSTWDEIKYQRGWKPEEDPVYKAVQPGLKYASWALGKQDEAINLYDKYVPKPTAPVQMPQSIKGVPETDPGRVLYDVAMESRALTPHDYMSEYEQLQQKYDLQIKVMRHSVNVGDSYRKLLALDKEINALRQKADLAGTPIPEKVNPVEASLDQFFQGGPEQFFAGIYGGISAAEEFLVNTVKGLFGGEKDHVSGARQDALDFQQAYQERLEKNTAGLSPLERGAVGLSQAAGNMLFGAGMTGAAGLPAHFSNATKVAISAGAGGESYITALQKGANIDQAAAYGLLAGATEYIAESLFGGNPLTDKAGTGLVSRLVKKLGGSSKLLGFLASKPVAMLSEGIEEIISEVLNPVWEYLTFNKNPEWASLEQVLEAGINGVVLSGVLQGGSAAIGKIANLATGSQTKMPTIELDPKQMSIVEKILKGEEISGNQAEIIAKSPEAIELLRQVTGQEINTDAPISALKKEIKALANGQAAITDTSPTVDTPTQRSAQRAAETPVTAYGKAGQKAINELYLQNQSREQYQADMSRFYQAGASGMQVEPYTGILTEPQRRGAYIAGQADAETSLAEEKYNAQFATVYKDDAGLIRNDYTPKLTKEETSLINTLFKAAGVKGEFVAPTGDKGANGWLDGGIVKIAQDAADPVMVVAKHEITHRMQEIAPEEYRQYRDYAVQVLGEDAVENKRTFYESHGVNLTYEQAMDEVAADFTEALLTDKSKIERLVSDNRTLAQRFFDAVKEFVAKVKAAFKGKAAQDAALAKYGVTIEQLEKATKLWEDTLKATAETVRTSEQEQRIEFSDVNVQYSLREKAPPEKTGIAYKVFYAKNGELYPPMVANPGGTGTPVGVWLDADIGQLTDPSKTGRSQVQGGGKGTSTGKTSLAFRPGWHLGDVPLAKQFARTNPETGIKELFPADFVWAECEYAMDVDYQDEAMSYGYTEKGKFRHAYAGLPKIPEDGYYRYRTNPNPDTVPWVITGAMKVNRILTDADVDAICRDNGVEPMARQGGPIDLAKLGLEGDARYSLKDSEGNALTPEQSHVLTEFSDKNNKRFSMKSPVEETKDLIALHNLSEDNMRGALELGGLAMPSLAVIKAGAEHSSYGNISLVFSKSTIDPGTNRQNKVYSGDAWTPTFPTVGYKVNENALDKIEKRIVDLVGNRNIIRQLDYIGFDEDNFRDYLDRSGGNLAEHFKGNNALRYAYLQDIGESFNLPMTEANIATGFDNDVVKRVYDIFGKQKLEELNEASGATLAANKELKQQLMDIANEHMLSQFKGTKYENIYRKNPLYNDSNFGFANMDNLINGALRYGKTGIRQEVDRYAAREALETRVDAEAFNEWLKVLFVDVVAKKGLRNERDWYTASGNRRSWDALYNEITLENVVNIMKKDVQKGGGAMFGGADIWGAATKEYKSIAEMKADSARLEALDVSEYEAIREGFKNRLFEIANEIMDKRESNNFIALDSANEAIVEALRNSRTVAGINRELKTYPSLNIKSDTAQKIVDLANEISVMPTEYFEAKPQRAVAFEEILAAVVPDSIDKNLLNDLKAAGLKAIAYESGNEVDRVRAVISVEGARFSMKDNEGRQLTEAQVEYFKDSKVRDENGNLLVVYHGTDREFTEFRVGSAQGWGRGIYSTDSKAGAEAYGKNTVSAYVNIVNPFDGQFTKAFENTKAYAEYSKKYGMSDAYDLYSEYGDFAGEAIRELGYDGIIAKDSNDITGLEIVAFSPEQIKSIDNKNPTGDPDIRHSLKGSKEYEQEIKEQKERARKAERRVDRLEELNQRLKEQMKVTKLAKTDRKALESLAREIIREYDIKMNAKDLVADLDEIYTIMANGKDSDGNDLTWEALKEKAVNLGRRLVRNASVLSNELQDDYRDMVRYFKGTRVKVSERNGKPQYKYEGGVKLKLADHFKSDMNDFNYFRKKHMGKFTLSNDGTPIDMVYAELCDVFPGYFNEDRHMTQPDQLQHIADVMDGIRPVYENPFAGQMKEAAEIMANDIIEQFYELPQQAPTFADKQARKYTERVVKDTKKLQAKNERIAELIEDGRRRVKDILRRETERRESAITKLKEHYQAKDAKTRDLQQRRELRNKIKRQINTLSQMLLRPSDTKHIPEALRKPVSEFLASIDLSTDRMGDNTLRRLDKLKSTYQKILDGTSDVQAEIDPDIIAKIEELSDALETKKLSELSRDELQNLWEITKGMRKTVTDYNKLFAQNIRETVSEMGTAAINEQGTKAYTESALRIKQSLANLVNMDMLDSFSFFEQLGPAMQRLFQNIRDGLDIKITHTKEAADYMIKLLRDTKIDEWTGSKAKAKTFVTSVGKISLTPSQVMSLYLLNRQPDAQNHMYAGGIKAAPVVTRAGKNRLPKITKSFETLKITPNDVNNIINSLSAEQKRIAEGISKFFTDYTAKWGNEVSMTLYSYEKFMVEKYFPIVSDRNYISQVYGEVTDKTLKNMGSTKARIEGANNPIIVEDAFDVFTRQADAMASYHAFVVPLTDIQRVWNFKTLDGSVKQTIEKRYGQRVLSYFSRLITDINGGARVEAGSEFVNTLIGRYKASRVGMNLRVVVQQPTSIIRASVMIDPKYLAKGATKKGNWNTVLKYAPIAQWKDWGYFNLYTGKQLKDIFLNKHRASDTFMLAAGKADQLAWQAMWNACEYEVQDTHPSLTKGSEEYYQAVASRFSDIIDRTQVVDSVLHRTQIMRSKDTLVKMSVAFMTEPMKTYNLFRLAAQDYMQNKTPDAKKRVVRTVIGLAATAIINSAIASLVDALRDDEDELSYWEKWLNSFADDVKWVVPEMFPYVKDLTSMLRGYDIKRMDMAAIGDFFNSVKMLASDKYTPVAKAANIIAKSADLFGIPASAIKREISTVINNVEGVFESELFEYYMETIMYDIDSTNNRSRYYDLVYRAWQKEDKYEFNKIVADLLKHGYTKDTIENAIQSRAKKSKEYVQEQANVYTPVADSLKSHEYYNTLSDRYKDKADDYAKQYANAVALKSVLEPNPDAEKIGDEIEKLRREMGDDYYNPDIQAEIISMELEKGYTPQKWVLGADGTDKYYFEPAKYILYRVALQMVDESNDNNSSYSTKERKAAMNLVGLNKEEQHYLEWLNKQ